jgi:hypothetical protein
VSLVVTCTVKVEQQKYDSSEEGTVFEEFAYTSSTGTFNSTPRDLVSMLIDGAMDMTKKKVDAKLTLIKEK